MNNVILTNTKKPIAMTGFDVPIESVLKGQGYRISRILTLLILNLKPISKTLSIGSPIHCESMGSDCACISIKQIYCFCHKRANTAYWPTDTNDADSKSVLALS